MNENQNSFWSEFPSDLVDPCYTHEKREMKIVMGVVIKGDVDVFIRRFKTPQLVVSGENEKTIKTIKTYIEDNKLIIDSEVPSEGQLIAGKNRIVFIGDGSPSNVCIINGKKTVSFTEKHSVETRDKISIGITLPKIKNIKIKGSGNVSLFDLKQDAVDLIVEGSGNIFASGQVKHLNVIIAGSGNVKAKKLSAKMGNLVVAGSGNITARVTEKVVVQIAGSGEIKLHGSPTFCSKTIAGSGSIKVK